MGCNKADCNKCIKKSRYCGEDLVCLDAIKGESYDSILKKINDLLCNQVEGVTYTFENNDTCASTGFTVLQTQGEVTEEVFSYCQECCGESTGEVIFTRLNNTLDFESGDDLGSNSFILPFNINSSIAELEATIINGGDYIINSSFIVVSTYDLALNFRLLLNGVPVPSTVKSVIVDGATPTTHTHTYVLNTVLSGLGPSDTINLEFKTLISPGGSPTPDDIFITSADLILNKI